MNDAHICTRGKIWDLHIHSNQCYSITDPKLKKLSVAEYVSSILEALSDFKDLEMISFTDHNHICFDLYKACLLYTSSSPNGRRATSRFATSAS